MLAINSKYLKASLIQGIIVLTITGCSSTLFIPWFPEKISQGLNGEILPIVDPTPSATTNSPTTRSNSPPLPSPVSIDINALLNKYGPAPSSTNEVDRKIPLSSFDSIVKSLSPLTDVNYITSLDLDEGTYSGTSVSSTFSNLPLTAVEHQASQKRYKLSYQDQNQGMLIYMPVDATNSFLVRALQNEDDFFGKTYRGGFSYAFPYGITGIIVKFSNDKDKIFTVGLDTPTINDAIPSTSYKYIGSSGITTKAQPDNIVLARASLTELMKDGLQAYFAITLNLTIEKTAGNVPLSISQGMLKVWFPTYAKAIKVYRAPNQVLNPSLTTNIPTLTTSNKKGYEFKTKFTDSTGDIVGEIRAKFYGSYFQGIGGAIFIVDKSKATTFYYWGGLGLTRTDGFQ